MDILTGLDRGADYSATQLQWILAAWVLTDPLGRQKQISTIDGSVASNYDKRSIYSIMYASYRTLGEVKSDTGTRYEATFNTWGYAWPNAWGPCPNDPDDPQRFGRNAYSGLFRSRPVRERIEAAGGRVHVVELGCGTGAGAHHVCTKVLPLATYQAFDMQRAAIQTCQRKFVPELGGRLVANWADATDLAIADQTADLVAVNETHVTDTPATVTDEDQRFFRTAHRLLKPGGFLVWGNAIPDSTWAPCFSFLDSIGLKLVEVTDLTAEAVRARDEDKARIDAYAEQGLSRFLAFRLPILGARKRCQAAMAWKNFCRNPGTNYYEELRTRFDTYKVAVLQKA